MSFSKALNPVILIFIAGIIFFAGELSAQIQGSVFDKDNNPVPYASVLLLNQKDSSLVHGVTTSEEGSYSMTEFKPGKYIIGVRMVGFKPSWSAPIEIKTANTHLHSEVFHLEEETVQIGDVQVVAKKPVYEQKIDRMVVNVENSGWKLDEEILLYYIWFRPFRW